jgi:hypothetical protein
MPVEAFELETTTPFDRFLGLLIGREKAGKSRLAATAPKPVLVLDTDGRAAALAGISGVYALTFREPPPHMQPTAFNDILDILTQLETNELDLSKLLVNGVAAFPHIAPGTKLRTLVADSVQTLARAAMSYALYSSPDMRRQLKIGGWQINFVKNFDGWNAEMQAVESVLLRMIGLSNVNIIATLHETDEEAPDSTIDKPKFTGRVGIFPVRYQRLLKYFNECYHVEQAPSMSNPSAMAYEPRVQVRPDFRCPWAVTALDLDQFEKPDIGAMIVKHMSKHPQSQTRPTEAVKQQASLAKI